jgi:hypothetical protein
LNVSKCALSTLAVKGGYFGVRTWAVEATEKNQESSKEPLNIALNVSKTCCTQMAGNNQQLWRNISTLDDVITTLSSLA